MDRIAGKVAWFNSGKGFGFLSHDGGAGVFCHFSAIQNEGYKFLTEGNSVLFDIGTGPTGRPQAENVVKVVT